MKSICDTEQLRARLKICAVGKHFTCDLKLQTRVHAVATALDMTVKTRKLPAVVMPLQMLVTRTA